mmetsp:Transcript_58702/g.166650  ORF Transcript_58702/g.166650 Transcript_58702/m.166650 type:complete len:108 (-) Transcript_58702:75-398(-)
MHQTPHGTTTSTNKAQLASPWTDGRRAAGKPRCGRTRSSVGNIHSEAVLDVQVTEDGVEKSEGQGLAKGPGLAVLAVLAVLVTVVLLSSVLLSPSCILAFRTISANF